MGCPGTFNRVWADIIKLGNFCKCLLQGQAVAALIRAVYENCYLNRIHHISRLLRPLLLRGGLTLSSPLEFQSIHP